MEVSACRRRGVQAPTIACAACGAKSYGDDRREIPVGPLQQTGEIGESESFAIPASRLSTRHAYYYAKLGVRVERIMTDNGSYYRSKTFRTACKQRGLCQAFTRPYTPKTNGKAEPRMGLRARVSQLRSAIG
jgi:hypothetical protein